MTRHDDLTRLRHMRDHAQEAIEFAANSSLDALRSDRMLRLCLTRLVEIVGKAASRISPETHNRLINFPWSDIIGMRHRIVHGYDRLNLVVLWETIVTDLPPLIPELDKLIIQWEQTPDNQNL